MFFVIIWSVFENLFTGCSASRISFWSGIFVRQKIVQKEQSVTSVPVGEASQLVKGENDHFLNSMDFSYYIFFIGFQ